MLQPFDNSVRDIHGCATLLPAGVRFLPLKTFPDDRGTFTEAFRDDWQIEPRPVQWNVVNSVANVLRGVHVHMKHVDVLTVVAGELILGLCDLRRASPTRGQSVLLRVQSNDMKLAVIPVGVAHGFYFPVPACHLYGVSTTFDGSEIRLPLE